MSEKFVAVLLSFGLLGGMFLWVPLLELICPPCGRMLRMRRRARQTTEAGTMPETFGADHAA